MPVHLSSPVARSRPSSTPSDVADFCHFVPMSSRFTKKSLVSVSGRLVKTPCLACADVGAEHAQAADQHRHLGRGQRQQLRLVDQQLGRRSPRAPCAGSCGSRRPSAPARRTTRTSVCSCEASVRPGVKGTFTSWPAFFAAASTAAQPPSTIRSASETFLPPDCAPLNSFWIASSVGQHLGQLAPAG